MAVAFVDDTTNTAAATTMSLSVPTGVVDGDVMLMAVMSATDTSTITISGGGWTSLRNQTDATNGQKLWTWWRLCSSEPGSYTVNASPAEDMAGCILGYEGNHASAPINEDNGSTTGNTQAHSSASILTDVDGCMIVAFYGADSTATRLPATPDGSPVATERVEVFQAGNNLSLYAQEYLQPTAATISLDMSWASAVDFGCVNVIAAIAPAAAGGGPSQRFMWTP
jgi:hypothetical protein